VKSVSIKGCCCPDERTSWDTIWKWAWFNKDHWKKRSFRENRLALKPLLPVLKKLSPRSILDCSCGLGIKTILLRKEGYRLEGSDSSTVAIKYAPRLSREEGFSIKYLISSYHNLPDNCHRSYDCVYTDSFDWIDNRAYLSRAARGIYSVLRPGGFFIFDGAPKYWTKRHLQRLINRDWNSRLPVVSDPPIKKGNLQMIRLEISDKTVEGIQETYLYITIKKRLINIEFASMKNTIKWTWKDYSEALIPAGFRSVKSVCSANKYYTIAVK